jgi:DNA-binding IclR family transcriptional regulator
MVSVLEPNKTKIAKRIIEVFEYFSDTGQKATVMDIVRRYGRPQSSTSELLSCLVAMGLLYKEPRSRCYTPTPRLAALGTSAQPEIIRDGGLFTFMDRFAKDTENAVALFGMVETRVQIFRLSYGTSPISTGVTCGASARISASAAGLLLLSTFAPDHASRMLWRLYAEADSEAKFDLAEVRARVATYRCQGYAVGEVGFAPGVKVAATLLPRSSIRRPLSMGIIIPANSETNVASLLEQLNRGIAKCARRQDDHSDFPQDKFHIMAV